LNVTTSFGLDFRNEYKQNILQNKVSVTSKFYRYNFFNFGFIDWDLERAEVKFFVDTQNVTNPYLKDQFSRLAEPQFNSIIGITLQHDNTNDIFSPTSGNYLSVSVEEAGILPKFLIKDREKLRYSQFYKVTLFGKLFTPISTDTLTVFASKLKFGFAKQYGERQEDFPIPLTRKFYIGGSNSIRGWRSRELGSVIKPELGGKLVIEGNLEMRIHTFKKSSNLLFLDANKIWLVCFLDFGNIWNNFEDIHLSEVAVAGGLGVRYDAFFGPIRFDFGFRIYDPYSVGNKWIMNKKIFSEIISKGQIHFGIGHAF
jgi:outer membrane protein insertion porin family